MGFNDKVKNIYNDKYEIIYFKDMETKSIIKCNKCNNTFEISPKEFIRTRNINKFLKGCKKCKDIDKDKILKERLKSITNSKLSFIDNDLVTGTHKNYLIKCNICGYEFKSSIHTIESHLKVNKNEDSFGCAVCSGKYKRTTDDFIKEVNSISNGEYTVLGKYTNSNSPILIKHNKCGHIYKVRPVDFIHKNNRCPNCNEKSLSNGVKFIEEFLSENNINFIKEKSFDNCKYRKKLPFDFYLEEYNLLIEYDGEQHFKKSFNRKESNHIVQHKRDIIKNNFCKTNKINLIRFKYNFDFNEIKRILNLLINDKLDYTEYKKLECYIIDIEDDIVYNENTYYKEFSG